jgi:hypothetical protein
MPVTMEAVAQVANDTEHFSSVWVNVGRPDAVRNPAPPITSDPPDHHGHRRLLLPSFSPKVIAGMEGELRRFCRELIAAVAGSAGSDGGRADAAAGYSQHIPVHAICELLGIPESDADMFRDWIFRNFQLGPRDNDVRAQVSAEMDAYVRQLFAERLDAPTDDLTSLIAHAEIDGEPVSEALRLGYVKLMIFAGIDTTWSAIGSGLWHFAQHPDQRARLAAAADDDMVWVTAVEEVLRFYAPVTMARKVVAPTEVAGCPVRPGEQMLLTFPAANHDPDAFEDAGRFDIDRAHNRHVAFGLGIHRCLGSNPGAPRVDRRPAGVDPGVPRLHARHVDRDDVGVRADPRPAQHPRAPQPALTRSRRSGGADAHRHGSPASSGRRRGRRVDRAMSPVKRTRNRRARRNDPTGWRTIQRIVGPPRNGDASWPTTSGGSGSSTPYRIGRISRGMW